MEGAQLVGIKALCANMESCNLQNCNFEDPSGLRSNLEGVNLKNACLENSNMAGVDLRVANLKGANMKVTLTNHQMYTFSLIIIIVSELYFTCSKSSWSRSGMCNIEV